MKLSIIIINYKSDNIIEKCISKINFDGEYEVIVVDNEDKPELMERVAKLHNVRVINYTANHGFAKGNNIAIRQAKGEYIMTLNADVFLNNDYINKCIKFLEDNNNYVSVQGKLISDLNKDKLDSTGNTITNVRYAYNLNQGQNIDITLHDFDVFGVCAAAAIYKKEKLKTARINKEYFDEDFFAYLEDVDLDWRFKLMGGKSRFLNDPVAYHIREASSNKKFRIFQALRNRLYLVIKNDTIFSLVLNLCIGVFILLFIPERKNNYSLILRMFRKRFMINKIRIKKYSDITKKFGKTPWRKVITKLFNFV